MKAKREISDGIWLGRGKKEWQKIRPKSLIRQKKTAASGDYIPFPGTSRRWIQKDNPPGDHRLDLPSDKQMNSICNASHWPAGDDYTLA
jgi:hypothetical protein